ncbi:MAG: response regulator [Deltaproteobacteria bacterium]|nr:response regulator [Deltaproteobacteria bacterium]
MSSVDLSVLEAEARELSIDIARPNRVMIVDDEQDNLDVLETLLEDEYEVSTAINGADAVALLESRGPVDLIIADQRMPQMTGVDLLAVVAVLHPSTVRIVLTGYSDVEPMVDAINRGEVYRFMLKPFNADEMRAVVSESMRLCWMRNALRTVLAKLREQNEDLYRTHLHIADAQRNLVTAERLVAVGRTAAGIAHSVRTQAAIAAVLLDALRENGATDASLAAAERAQTSSLSLLELLECLHRLAQPGRDRLIAQSVDVCALLEHVIGSWRTLDDAKDQQLDVSVASEAENLSFDLPAIRQALLGMLRFASEVGTPTGTKRLAVSLGEHGDAQFELEFGAEKDPTTQIPTLGEFEPSAPGLSLQVALLAAESQGGRLNVSTADKRARVLLQLPQRIGATA